MSTGRSCRRNGPSFRGSLLPIGRVTQSTVRALPAGARGAVAVAAGRQSHADSPRHARPDRPAADARGGGRVRERSVTRGVRASRRPAVGFARLRRAVAIRWLDAARYADTNGYQTDGERSMWRGATG